MKEAAALANKWAATALEIFMGAIAVLSDIRPKHLDALFAYGAPVRDDELDHNVVDNAAILYTAGIVDVIVLNGLRAVMCTQKNLAYSEFEKWLKRLVALGVKENNIVLLAPSVHVAAEDRNLLTLTRQHGWTNIGMFSQAFH